MKGTRNNIHGMGKRKKHIPQDIIDDILVNLPVKSLLRFKCVSKQWHSLISSKSFTKEHLKKSSNLVRHNLIYTSWDYNQPYQASGSRSLKSCSLKSFFDEQNYDEYSMVKTSYHDSFMPNSGSLEDIVGSCNGLILITLKTAPHWFDLVLWNPSTRQVKIIPPPPYARRYWDFDYFMFGFGYDDSNDDYKVVTISVSKPGPNKTHMYSLRTNSWKKIGNFEKDYLQGYSGTHVNGKLHWLVEEVDVGGNQIIVSLSLVDGKYDIVPLRPLQFKEYNRYSYYDYTLHDLGGYLSLMRKGVILVEEFWVMMTYGEVESWTNIWGGLNLSDQMRSFGAYWPQPIWLTKDGDLVVAVSGSKVVVSKKRNKSRVVVSQIKNKPRVFAIDSEILRLNIFVESLVSPYQKHGQ